MTWCLLVMLAASDDDLTAQVKTRLDPSPVVRGRFEQKKQVKGFKRPLVSTGDFVVSRGRGVRWHTATPFDSVLTVRPDDIRSTQNGAEVFKLDATKEPTVRVINQVLFALLAGDAEVLRAHFVVTGSVDAKRWHLALVPKSKGLAQVLARVSLEGDDFVRQLELTEGSGDVTQLHLEVLTGGAALTAAEEAGW
jgi:Outer membrane lipoprotein carrier protein LolA